MTVSRSRRLVLVVAALLAVLAATVPDLVSYAAESAPRGPVTTVDETSRAGSRPGVGRERPGRAEPLLPPLPPSTPPPTPPSESPRPPRPEPTPVPYRDAASEAMDPGPEGPVLPVPRVLPFGGGLVLIGLGLGFLGLRLRRG
ncbi:hypothetical protein AB0B50_12645 [Streptomyces sp. NPDC041068]|uniref:hypothetical protein n=1 Tax=Streptomyces sp. NPDC041068 TaxID=3155130 RepID=UPI0033C8D1EC